MCYYLKGNARCHVGNVYHCSPDRSPWIISFGSFDPIGTARGDIYLIRIIVIIIFGAHSARSTGFRLDCYSILYFDFGFILHVGIVDQSHHGIN